MYFSKQLELIEDLFSHGCFVSAHAEVKKLEQFTAMFAERATLHSTISKSFLLQIYLKSYYKN